ncbi:MAG: fibronectin type III domain-containing protein [bacterium]
MMLTLALIVTLTGIAPPTGLTAADRPDDGGRNIRLAWQRSGDPEITSYRVLRQEEGSEDWQPVGLAGRLAQGFTDGSAIDGVRYRYTLMALSVSDSVISEPSGWAASAAQWFDNRRLSALIWTVLFIALILAMIQQARRGRKLFIRRIAGLDAVEEALGRATEMGRPILYVPGLSSIADVATIAALNILSEVAKKTASFGTPLIVPNRDPIVYTVAREMVKEAYTAVGRPDAYNPDMVFFLTDQQFAFAAAVDGIMVRDKPATNFLMGMFWAESLIMAETGASTGAIQIAGTDSLAQLPFFITACDYTLIGEELYAASAYISREPLLLGSIRGQDLGKAIILAAIVIGTALALLADLPVLKLF